VVQLVKGLGIVKHILTVVSILLLAPLASLQAAESPKAGAKPNIVFLFADDMGWGDLHCYGHPYAKTPNLDKLASQGTRFTQFYATGVTCCPSRTGFMTSKFPATFPKYPANAGFGDRVTITELLKRQGYATGHFGKWHIGPDTKAGTYGINAIGGEEEKGVNRRASRLDRGRDAYIYDSAIRFIETHKDGPFYINVWGHIPHHPVNPSPSLVAAFGDLTVDESKFPPQMREKFSACKKHGGDVSQHLRVYLAELKALDENVGRLLQRLDELGLRENTIVVFSSDQGPAGIRDTGDGETPSARRLAKKEHKIARRGTVAPAVADQPQAPDADIRLNAMGFIVRWPGHVPAGRVDETAVLSGADWLPTLGALAGVTINPADFEGEDASQAWLGGEFARTKPLFWKTSAPQSTGTIRDGQWKLHYPNRKRGEIELYDISADPGEMRNLAAQHPDVVQKLSARLEAWQATLPKQYDKAADKEE
jgi:N-acetylgalactosamine-6-sulfatase